MNAHTGQVGLISNPGSGHNREQFTHIAARIDQCQSIHHIITHSPADIAPALQDLAARNISVLAINGGDGTVSAILGELLEREFFATPPLIAVLPGGTANMNAGDIGVRGSLNKAVVRFCQWSEGDRETEEIDASPFFSDVTAAAGVDFKHRSSTWLGEFRHKQLKTPPTFSGGGVAAVVVDG